MNSFPKTQYTERNGAQIAFQVVGSGPVDVVHCAGLVANCDHVRDVAGTEKVLEQLASYVRLILFDRRGTGHSDPFPDGTLPTWEDWADDVLAVMDAANSRKAVINGERDGGIMALLFAAMHPDRTLALCLGNAFARYLSADDYPCGKDPQSADETVRLIRDKWGTDELTLILQPKLRDSPKDIYMRSRCLRGAATPRQAAAHFRYVFDIDARSILSSIKVPTLITNRVDNRMFPVEQGRYLAENLPNARLLELPGSDGAMLISDEGPHFLEALVELATGSQVQAGPETMLATVLFCDIVNSTSLAAQMGNNAWHELLQRFYAVVRESIGHFGGREVDNAGDGFFVVFDRPTLAISCARAIVRSVNELNIKVRCGVHTGECSKSDGKVTGLAVHVGARIAAAAQPNEIWASDTVKALTLGSGILYSDRGRHHLKGVPDVWALYAAEC